MRAYTEAERAALLAEIKYNRENCFCSDKTLELFSVAESALTTPPVAALVPIELPSAFTPSVIALGPSPVSGMRLDHTGGWLNKARVIAAIRTAGYEVANAPAEGKK